MSLFFISLLGFVAGLLTLPLFFPDDPNTWHYFPPWLGSFPHLPTVFGPLALANGGIFILASRDFTGGNSKVAAVAGGAVLFLLASSGITLQVSGGVPLSFPTPLVPFSLLAGLTVLGYGLIAAGFQLDSMARATKSVSPIA